MRRLAMHGRSRQSAPALSARCRLSAGAALRRAAAAPAGDGAAETADDRAAASRGAGAAGTSGPHPGGGGGFLPSPAVTVGCRITMSVVMAFMLLIAL